MDKAITRSVAKNDVSQCEEVKKEIDAAQFSLKANLENAEYDMGRIVDAKNILSTEILQEFIPATRIKGKEDFISESSHYQFYDNHSHFNVVIEKEYMILNPPKKSSTGVLNYYLMDGGSVLPVLALDIRPGHKVLDMCAAPGGKSLLALQTLYPKCVVSNDVSNSRLDRIKNVYEQFLFDFKEKWLNSEKIQLSNRDGRYILEQDIFDRILVDVPCTTDRHSLHENDNNIFKPSRIKERLLLPELQRIFYLMH
ncbi:hypothetical protein NQ317_007368 [Molorchus minor]|uniref:NOL1/NOP2/Sun domain family member 4 n=1 Tax=Molorchus minor TaxID=1323400 RepID=A0ABQ9JC91_9CUCU|nr:hypothetical protein NQ317_007368 [Molorchus minor]